MIVGKWMIGGAAAAAAAALVALTGDFGERDANGKALAASGVDAQAAADGAGNLPPLKISIPAVDALFPNIDDGKPVMQIGIGFNAYWARTDPFVNILHTMPYNWTAVRAYPNQKEVMTFEEMKKNGFIDKETMLPNAIPPGYETVRSGLFRGGAKTNPDYYSGVYVFEWEGDAEARFGFKHPTREVTFNKIEARFSPQNKDWSNIEFTHIGPGGVRNLALYRKEDEALQRAGVIYHPRFIDHVGDYKIVRTLDLQGANVNWTRSVDDLSTKAHVNWGFPDFAPGRAPQGMPIEALFDLAVDADVALWMHVAGVIGAPPEFEDETLKGGEGAGDRVRALASANAPKILNSPEWRKYADEIVRSLIATGYPQERMLYVEQANEVWNFAHPFWRMTNYFWGIGDRLKEDGRAVRGETFRWALGYMTAQFMVTLDDALEAAGREQAVTHVLAGQMANPRRMAASLSGFRSYFEERNIDPAPYLARLGVSAASYYYDGGAMDLKNGLFPAANGEERAAKWIAAIERDPEGLKRRLTDRIISGDASTLGTLDWIVARRNEHQKLAEEAGAFFLGDYEGHDHFSPPGELKKNPRFVNWFESWRAGPEGERLTRAWVEALRKQNPRAVISNFSGIGDRDPEGDDPNDASLDSAWIDNFWGEETGRTRALKAFLRGGDGEG